MQIENRIFQHSKTGPDASLSEKARLLLEHQKTNWPFARPFYEKFHLNQYKRFSFEGSEIVIQYNPSREKSSSAKTDKESIAKRECFLCADKLPEGQLIVPFNEEYVIMANPFPIFPEHFTIPSLRHIPQLVFSHFSSLLKICRQINDYSVFYNGPRSGASAPDHFHFQAGTKNYLPVEKEFENDVERFGKEIFSGNDFTVLSVNHPFHKYFAFRGTNEEEILKYLQLFYRSYQMYREEAEEPRFNLIATYTDEFRVLIFPRDTHRPRQYFAEGDEYVMISPAYVEMGGLGILPRKEDFDKMSADLMVDIIQQSSMEENSFLALAESFRKMYS